MRIKQIYSVHLEINLDPVLKSLLHALNIVFYFANEVTNVTVHCVGKYKLVPVSLRMHEVDL